MSKTLEGCKREILIICWQIVQGSSLMWLISIIFQSYHFFYLYRTTISIYKMIENIITLTKESEYKSREIVAEKRKGDLLLYDVSIMWNTYDIRN